MSKKEFQLSKEHGAHRQLATLVGNWSGTSRVWYEPGEPAEIASISGNVRAVLDGRFVLHEYERILGGVAEQGMAMYGYHLDRQCYEAAWIDSAHTGTQLMFCESAAKQGSLDVIGHYGGYQGDPPWGWRTRIEMPERERLLITMFNITPQGEETKAIEIDYARSG